MNRDDAAVPETLGGLVRRLHLGYVAAWNLHADHDVTAVEFEVLTALRDRPPVDQTQLARLVALDDSTLSGVCRRLERDTLIARRTPLENTRQKLVELTAAGNAAVGAISARADHLNGMLYEESPDAAGQLAELLNDIGERWESVARRTDL